MEAMTAQGDRSLGLEDGRVAADRITASSCSPGTTPSMARLNSGDSWCAGDINNCFLQVDLGKPHRIVAVATQGNRAPTSKRDYVSKYYVKHSDDGISWVTYEEPVDPEIVDKEDLDDAVKLIGAGAADDAKRLHDAMEGWGTDENTLIEILCSRNNTELAAIRKVYEDSYNRMLTDDLKGDLSGDFRTLLLELSKGERDGPGGVDMDLATADAKDLLAAGVKKWGTDEAAFIRVFTQRHLKQLSAMFSEYEKLGVGDMAATINSEMSGDLRKTFLMLVDIASDSAKFFAQRLHVALEAGDWNDVCRIIFSRSGVVLEELSTAFLTSYGTELVLEVEAKYDGDRKASLLKKLRGGKELETKVFEGNTDHLSVKKNYLKQPIEARYVRFYPLAWFVWPCLSIELYGNPVAEDGPSTSADAEEEDVFVEAVADEGLRSTPAVDTGIGERSLDDERERWERDRKIWEEDKKRLEEELKRYQRHVGRQGEDKDWESEWRETEKKRVACELNRKELTEEKEKWERGKIAMETSWKKREDELRESIEEEKKKRLQAEERIRILLSRQVNVPAGSRTSSQESEGESPKKRERKTSAVDRMIERDQKAREEEWKRFEEEKKSWEEQRIKFQQERKKWDLKRIEWEEQNRKREEERKRKEAERRRLSEDRKKLTNGPPVSVNQTTTTRLTIDNQHSHRVTKVIEIHQEEEAKPIKPEKSERYFKPIVVHHVVDTRRSPSPLPSSIEKGAFDKIGEVTVTLTASNDRPDKNGGAPLASNDFHEDLDENGLTDEQDAVSPKPRTNGVDADHDHAHVHEVDREGHFDQFKRFMKSCDHLVPPTDPAATSAAESSFFSKYDEADSNLRPFPSWFGGLDLGSTSRLYLPFNNPFTGPDVETLLRLESDGIEGWRRLKRSRELEIWRKEGKGPVTMKATMILNKIPYKDAIDLIGDMSTRTQWDHTFDSVQVVEEAEDKSFKVVNCTLRKKNQSLALATMDKEDFEEPYYIVAWKNADHPNVPAGPETTLITLDTLICGLIIRPYYDGTKYCKITIITQLQSSAPGALRNTYLTGNPAKWLVHLKKYHAQCLEKESSA